ncbi:MAG: cytochrome c oxidase assembly protein subunit 15, partial [Cyclobacteriaceae bacterium]
MSKAKRRFSRVTLITTIAVYFLILVGGIVRNTGSGMGCPDWPKCFGGVVPPTSDVDLPDDYQSYYLEKRLDKTQRLVVLLNRIGLERTAELVENDPYLYEEESFDVTTAWIEYLNRLLGVLIG